MKKLFSLMLCALLAAAPITLTLSAGDFPPPPPPPPPPPFSEPNPPPSGPQPEAPSRAGLFADIQKGPKLKKVKAEDIHDTSGARKDKPASGATGGTGPGTGTGSKGTTTPPKGPQPSGDIFTEMRSKKLKSAKAAKESSASGQPAPKTTQQPPNAPPKVVIPNATATSLHKFAHALKKLSADLKTV